MPSPTTPDRAEALRRVRSWRRAFLVYAGLLTLGTHWPKLRLSTDVPITDKTAHLAAFALLAVLLWRTRWLRSRWLVMLVVVPWAALDEWSQAIPVLQRHATWHDLLANVLGVLVAGAWLWALRPVGGVVNRMRLALHECAFDRLLLAARPIGPLLGVFAACLVPVLLTRAFVSPAASGRVVLLACAAWLIASAWIVLEAWRRERERLSATRTCFACGAEGGAIDWDDAGRGVCANCSASLHAAQWTDPQPPPLPALVALMRWPGIIFLSAFILVGGAVLLAPPLYAAALDIPWASGPAVRLARAIGGMPSAVARAIDMSIALLVLAIAVRVYRARLARYFDRSVQCRVCGHDLRATPTVHGIGRCGECGTEFVLLETAS